MYVNDKEQYTDAKGPFIRSIVRLARDQDVPIGDDYRCEVVGVGANRRPTPPESP